MIYKSVFKSGIEMSRIRALYNPNGETDSFHWFDRSTMKFFRTKLPRIGYEGPGGIYFVTSEQFVGSQGAMPRRYSVRRLISPGDINTIGEFNSYSKIDATHEAKRLAAGE